MADCACERPSPDKNDVRRFCSNCYGTLPDTPQDSRTLADQVNSEVPTGSVVEVTDDIVLTTGYEIPGREIAAILGVIYAAGNAAWTIEGTAGRSSTAGHKAFDSLKASARALGASAVVGVSLTQDGSGNALSRSQTVALLGTAVTLKAPRQQEQ